MVGRATYNQVDGRHFVGVTGVDDGEPDCREELRAPIVDGTVDILAVRPHVRRPQGLFAQPTRLAVASDSSAGQTTKGRLLASAWGRQNARRPHTQLGRVPLADGAEHWMSGVNGSQ